MTGTTSAAPVDHPGPAYPELLANSGADVLFEGSTEGVTTWVSASIEQLLGWTPEQLIGRPFAEFVVPGDVEGLRRMQQRLNEGHEGKARLQVRHSDGSARWIDVTVRPMVDDAGRVTGRYGSWRDAEEEVLARDALRAALAERDVVLGVIPDPMMRLGAARADGGAIVDFTFIDANVAALTSLGLSREDVVGRLQSDVYPQDQVPALRRAFTDVVQTGEPLVADDYPYQFAGDTSPRYFDMRGARLADGLVLVFRDVTTRAKAQQALAAEREHLQAVLDSQLSPRVTLQAVRDGADAIVDFAYVDANSHALAYLGVTMEQLGALTVHSIFPSEVAADVVRLYAHTVETGEVLVRNDFAYDSGLLTGDHRLLDLRGAKLGDGLSLSWEDVTDRVQAAQRLAESEARFRLLAENVSEIIYSVGPDHLVTWVSPSITRILGWQPEEIEGSVMADLLHADDQAEIDDAGLARIRSKDGTYRWVTNSVTSLHDSEGRPVGLVGALTTVDNLVEAQQHAERNEALLRATSDALLDPLVVFEPVRDDAGYVTDFMFVDVNRATTEYLNLAHDQFIGRRILDLFPAFGSSGLLDTYRGVLATHESAEVSDFVYDNDVLGIRAYYDLRITSVVGDRLCLTWRDVTAQRTAAARIAESEQRFRLLAENAADVVVRIRDGIIVWVSPSVEAIDGVPPERWEGLSAVDFVHPDDLEVFSEALAHLSAGGSHATRLRVNVPGGMTHWVEAHARLFLDDDGTPDGLISSLRVIDDLVEVERELQHRAQYDMLTGLMNRSEVLNQISRATARTPRTGHQTAVLFCDIDHFKEINDAHGHAAGDEVLRTLGERITSVVRTDDWTARIGGDELLVVLQGVRNLDDATTLAEKVREAAHQRIALDHGVGITPSLSIGVTLLRPGETTDELVARADNAMYLAKEAGRNRVVAID
jgi:diguanylate cyclase (GGDEF)-like protein/PAS domain S-box-containing protein